MKKLMSALLIVTVLFSLVGCIVVDESPKKEENEAEETLSLTVEDQSQKEEAKELTFALKETAVFDDMKITAEEIKESEGKKYFEPEKGNVFVGVKFTVENTSDEEITVSSLLLFDAYADDIKAEQSFTASTVFTDGNLDGTIAPGKKLVGWYSLEVPKEWKTIELNVKSDWLSNSSAKFVFEK